MKKIIHFHKAFLPAAILTLVLITLGIVGFVTKGINLGVDFQAGINQTIQLAYPAFNLTYSGAGTPVLSIGESEARLIFSGANVESRTVSWNLKTVGSISKLLALIANEGVTYTVVDGADLPASLIVPTYQGEFVLGEKPILVHRYAKSEAELFGSVEQIRAAVEPIGTVSVQSIGAPNSMRYMIRVRDDGTDKSFSEKIPAKIEAAIEAVFGSNKVVGIQTAYVGAKFSQDLADNAWKLTLLTLFAILAYSAIRFQLKYSIGAVLAIVHDGLIMLGFMVWTSMEFNTTSIAAILTILGYSINDTIVIFDRIRDEVKMDTSKAHDSGALLDKALTETLGRTFITTITTMLAVIALYVFTSGSIKDFALALIVGMVSGVYSTIYIATGFVYFWDKMSAKNKNKKVGMAVKKA